MKNKELLEWIYAKIEEKYRADLQTARYPQDVKRMSLHDLGNAMGMSHSNISRLSKHGKPGERLLKGLSEVFNTPLVEVYRIAGIIEHVDPSSEIDAKILNVSEQMDPDIKAMYLKIGQGLIEDKQSKKNILQAEQIS